jgi:hypothetical protein
VCVNNNKHHRRKHIFLECKAGGAKKKNNKKTKKQKTICRGSLAMMVTRGAYNAERFGSVSFPESNVGVITARDDVFGICGEFDAKDTLHALRMVHFTTTTLVDGKYADGTVVRTGHELASRGRVFDVEYGANVIDVYIESGLELAHIEGVAVVILVSDRKVKRLHGIPRDDVGVHGEHQFAHRCVGAQVEEQDGPITLRRGRHNVVLDRVEGTRCERVIRGRR